MNNVKNKSNYNDTVNNKKVITNRAVLLRIKILSDLVYNIILQNESYNKTYNKTFKKLSNENAERVRNNKW